MRKRGPSQAKPERDPKHKNNGGVSSSSSDDDDSDDDDSDEDIMTQSLFSQPARDTERDKPVRKRGRPPTQANP